MPLYRFRVDEVDAELLPDGATEVVTPTRVAFVAEALTPWDAVLAWAAQLEQENAS